MNKHLSLSLKIIVSSLLIVYVVSTNDLVKVYESLSNVNLSFILFASFLLILNYIFSSLRWYYLNIDKTVSFLYLLKLYFVGAFFNNFLPTSIGGDSYKIYKLGQKIGSTTHAFTSTFLERFIGMLTLLILSIYGFFLFSSTDVKTILITFIFVIFSFLFFLIYYPKYTFKPKALAKIFDILDKVHNSFHRYIKFPRIIFISFLLSFIVQFSAIFSQFFVFRSLGVLLPIDFSFFSFPLIFISGYAIPSLNGLGSQEVLYQTFFIQIGLNSAVIVASSFLYHTVRLGVSLIGGIIYAFEK
jgi:uncharacterized membrane protein YbhN (UPF0104 family)